jgi:hypothetical protein
VGVLFLLASLGRRRPGPTPAPRAGVDTRPPVPGTPPEKGPDGHV